MNERIKKLTELTLGNHMHPQKISVAYDRKDLFLPPVAMSAKRVSEYILAQEPVLFEESMMTGLFLFDESVEGNIFERNGHQHFSLACKEFYKKPIKNLVTFEWQHSTGNFEDIIKYGIENTMLEIKASKQAHRGDAGAQVFLDGLLTVCHALIDWAQKCAVRAAQLAQTASKEEYRENLFRLSRSLSRLPEKPARNFYEAILSLYICFSLDPDSIGLIDRYLYPYYQKDMESGAICRAQAKEYLQELFLMLQAHISKTNLKFYRGGESHFAIGGYLPNGEDGFNDLSQLIVESLMELPTYIPQVSLRWTKKTPAAVFRFMMDCERRDPNKRIAFVNDEPKIEAFTKHLGMSYENAVSYTMVGCNEVAFPGGLYMGSAQENIVRSLERTLYERKDEIITAKNFDEFYAVYEKELFADLCEILAYEDKLNLLRARDVNIVSSILFKGCIQRAKSVTQGGAELACSGIDLIGIPNVIDSLCVIAQFVYEQKLFSMPELLAALESNWKGYGDMRLLIKKKCHFFGNDDTLSNSVAMRFTESLYRYLADKRSVFGHKYLVGNLIGYHEHHKFFGRLTRATPDGRYDGQPTKFGLGQSEGNDRKGLAALLNAVAKCDPYRILNGPTVTNVTLEAQLMKNDAYFEKTVQLFETYLQNGGIHFQLTYVSKEELLSARENPDQYRNLRVRVSGFSDYFVNLNEALQDDVIRRTEQHA